MSELPTGWILCRLGNVIKIQNGYAFPSKDFGSKGIPLVKQSNLAGSKVSLEKCVYLDAKYLHLKPDFVLKKNDVLIGMSGSVGKLCIYDLDQPALQNQRTGKVVPFSAELLSERFIWEYLKTVERQLLEKGKGLGVLNVSADDIEALSLPLSPLNEQRRIVAKLEKLLSKVEACRARLDTVPVTLKRFRQSVLAAACSGRLTADWRAAHPDVETGSKLVERITRTRNPQQIIEAIEPDTESEIKTWCWVSFGSVIGELRNGIATKPEMAPPGLPILRISSTRSGKVDLSDIRYLPNAESLVEVYSLKNNDLLFTRYNGSLDLLGVCGMVRGIKEKTLLYPDKLMRVRFNHDFVMPEYAEIFFQAPVVRDQVTEKSKSSAGQNGVSGSDIKSVSFAVAPLEEQQEIVRRVAALFKVADALEARYKRARAHVDKLTQSILAKAFRGELVPQDPNDEPAAMLLERIRAARVDRTKPGKGSGKRKTPIKSNNLFDF